MADVAVCVDATRSAALNVDRWEGYRLRLRRARRVCAGGGGGIPALALMANSLAVARTVVASSHRMCRLAPFCILRHQLTGIPLKVMLQTCHRLSPVALLI